MLQELTIRDFAIIEKMDLEFQSQMTVLTGETGAGKSIIIDALGLLSGGRGSVDFIRKGANKAVIQGLFDVPGDSKTNDVLDEFGIDVESDGLILQRDIYRSGKNICRINGAMVNLTTLAPDIVAAILDETLPSEVTLFDLASGTPLLWDEQRAQIQSVCRVVSLAEPDD